MSNRRSVSIEKCLLFVSRNISVKSRSDIDNPHEVRLTQCFNECFDHQTPSSSGGQSLQPTQTLMTQMPELPKSAALVNVLGASIATFIP